MLLDRYLVRGRGSVVSLGVRFLERVELWTRAIMKGRQFRFVLRQKQTQTKTET